VPFHAGSRRVLIFHLFMRHPFIENSAFWLLL